MNKCKSCGKKFTPVRSTLERACSIECALKLAKVETKVKKAGELRQLKAKLASKSDLQREVNKLARMIDKHYGHLTCIDCDKQMNKQVHGAHFHDVGGHNSLRFNLHNIHSATSYCNRFNSNHKTGYRLGIIRRYGAEYLDYIESVIPVEYKYVKVSGKDVSEKIKIVRALIRNFNEHVSDCADAISARSKFNRLIGIYL